MTGPTGPAIITPMPNAAQPRAEPKDCPCGSTAATGDLPTPRGIAAARAAAAGGPVLLILCILVAFNLQAGLVALGPVLPALTADLRLSNTAAGALAAVPLLMMGLVAAIGGGLADRWGAARTIAAGLALLGVAGALRGAAPGWPLLLAATVLFGAGIGTAQPALPRLVRGSFPDRLGMATGLYTTGIVIGQVAAAGLTGPLLLPAVGWRGALAFWGLLAVAALIPWLLLARSPRTAASVEPSLLAADGWSPWRDRRIWIIALLFAGQGLSYLLLATWLPAVYGELGISPAGAGARLALLTASCLPVGLLMPAFSDRLGSRRLPLLASGLITLAAGIGFVVAPADPVWGWVWPVLAGLGPTGVFVLVLVQVAEAPPAGRTGAASGMVMAVGYGAAFLGPVIAGAVRDATGGFRSALIVVPLVAVAMIVLALLAPETARRR